MGASANKRQVMVAGVLNIIENNTCHHVGLLILKTGASRQGPLYWGTAPGECSSQYDVAMLNMQLSAL